MDDKSFYERLFSFAGNKLKLYTGFSQKSFAKEKLFRLLDCKGCVISHQTYCDWKFDQTFSEDDNMILEGAFEVSFSLFSLVMDLQNEIAIAKKTHAISSRLKDLWLQFSHFFDCYYKAIAECKNIPVCGLLGIHFSANNEILFLPHEVIEKPLQCDGDELYSSLLGCWTTPQKSYERSHYFFLANILYFIFTGKLAYQNKNTEQRLEDYIDSNFVPIEFEVNINENIALWINSVLVYGEKNLPKQPHLKKSFSEVLFFQKDFQITKKQQKTLVHQHFKIRLKRFVKKNITTMVIGFCAIVITVFMTLSILKTQKEKISTRGLTAFQTIELFYFAMQNLQSETLSATLAKNVGKSYTELITNLFVISRVRQSYEGSYGFLSPQEWSGQETDSIFGIANLYIEQQPLSNLTLPSPAQEIESPVNKKENISSTYLFFSPADNKPFKVETVTENFMLEFVHDRWLITAIETERKEIPSSKIPLLEHPLF
ncbi:MAG: hypothetical protein ACRC4W_00280 [Treponemataceae bacterium]